MKTIYIHIGVGKTGTTTIQRYMADHHKEYSVEGMRYIQAGGGASGNGHQNFAKSFISKLPHYMVPADDVTGLRDLILKEIEECDENNILLSSENFPLADPDQIRKYFESSGLKFKYKIVMFVRSQDELAESEYNQLVKVRAEKRTQSEYIDTEFDADFFSLASGWGNVFGMENVICKVFDALQFTVITDFLDCLPISPIPGEHINTVASDLTNKSLGCAALTIKRILNILQPTNQDQLHIELPVNLQELIKDIDLPPILMSSHEAFLIRQRFSKSNRMLNKHFLKKDSSDLGGRRYSDERRDEHMLQCKNLINPW